MLWAKLNNLLICIYQLNIKFIVLPGNIANQIQFSAVGLVFIIQTIVQYAWVIRVIMMMAFGKWWSKSLNRKFGGVTNFSLLEKDSV